MLNRDAKFNGYLMWQAHPRYGCENVSPYRFYSTPLLYSDLLGVFLMLWANLENPLLRRRKMSTRRNHSESSRTKIRKSNRNCFLLGAHQTNVASDVLSFKPVDASCILEIKLKLIAKLSKVPDERTNGLKGQGRGREHAMATCWEILFAIKLLKKSKHNYSQINLESLITLTEFYLRQTIVCIRVSWFGVKMVLIILKIQQSPEFAWGSMHFFSSWELRVSV